MKNCHDYQNDMNNLAAGENQPSGRANIKSLLNHATVCPACSNHAISTLILVNGQRSSLDEPSPALESALAGKLDQIDGGTGRGWLKVAAVILLCASAFALGHWTRPPAEIVVQETIVTAESAGSQPALPAIAIEPHEYGSGFLAGRSFVINDNN